MWDEIHVTTVSNGEPTRKDTIMKLLYILAAILALTLAEDNKKVEDLEIIEDSEAAAANVELLKEGVDLKASASSYPYVPPSQRPPQWQNPQNSWPAPVKEPINTWVQPPNDVQNDYWGSGAPAYHPHPPTTTTPVPVIKNEQYFGDNGYYKYEYQIADGTHVGEEGYYTNPHEQTEDNLVKRGWYSYRGADGKTYTVTYWADKSGYHAYGDHLPTPPPPPSAGHPVYYPQNDEYPAVTPAPTPKPEYKPPQKPVVQEVPSYNPQAPVHDTPQAPSYPPQVPSYNPPQIPSYNPPQAPSYNPPQAPSYNPPQAPSYNPPAPVHDTPQAPSYPSKVPSYNPPQVPSYNPPQAPSYNPPQAPSYNPPQVPSYNPPQQTYYPSQQNHYPQLQNNYIPNYNV